MLLVYLRSRVNHVSPTSLRGEPLCEDQGHSPPGPAQIAQGIELDSPVSNKPEGDSV